MLIAGKAGRNTKSWCCQSSFFMSCKPPCREGGVSRTRETSMVVPKKWAKNQNNIYEVLLTSTTIYCSVNKCFREAEEKRIKKELSLANSGVSGKHRANMWNRMDAEREGTIQFSQHTLRSKHGSKYLEFTFDRKHKKWQGNSDGERKTKGRKKGTENYNTERVVMEWDSAKYKLVWPERLNALVNTAIVGRAKRSFET